MNRRWSAVCAAVMAARTFLMLVSADLAPALAPPGREAPARQLVMRELGLTGSVPVPTVPPPEGTSSPAPTASPAPAPVLSPAPADAPETPLPEATAEVRPFTDRQGELIRNRTRFEPDIAALTAEPLSQRLPREGAQILILHTHGTEAYTPVPGEEYAATDPYRTTDPTRSVIRVGDVLQQALEAQGFTVIHDRTLYDYPGYTGSYERSEKGAERALAEHPGVGVIIDLHRDALGDEGTAYKTVAQLEGEGAAQVMLVIGTGENGLEHPRWQENLKLALALQLAMNEACPTLARPIHLARERYNQHLSAGAFILEVGTNGNTLSEAERAAEAFARAAGPIFASLVEGED